MTAPRPGKGRAGRGLPHRHAGRQTRGVRLATFASTRDLVVPGSTGVLFTPEGWPLTEGMLLSVPPGGSRPLQRLGHLRLLDHPLVLDAIVRLYQDTAAAT